ncbi:MAG TPA: response regulator transcription factor [Solirubrobacteraceae bacterium]|nr:response regulator transcription factor [Solirubrobacteraceae bacterium]
MSTLAPPAPPVSWHTEETPAALKVLIADDHPLMLAGVRRVLEDQHDIEVVGQASSAPELLALVERRSPDLVLMDLRMPGVIGPELIARINERWPQIKVVVLSASDDRASVDSALGAGANAFIVKTVDLTEVVVVLRQVRGGGSVFHAPAASRAARDGFAADPEAPAGPSLTEREKAVLGAVAAGMTTARISKELWVSEHTVKFHLTNIYRKLGVPNRAAAVRYALEHGFASAA